METVKISWSGGKDSTAACLLHLQAWHKCIIVCYVPMLKDTIPLITKAHYQHIIQTSDLFRSMGAEVHIVSGISYYDHVHTINTKGKNKGKYRGICLGFGFCKFRNYSKIKAIESFKCDFDYEDIGIAFDEPKRQAQLTDTKRSILCERHITEAGARQICIENGVLSPLYNTNSRDGCAICPNAKPKELLRYVTEYPEAHQIIIDIESFCKKYRPESTPYRNYQWFTDRIKQAKQEEECKLIYADCFFER